MGIVDGASNYLKLGHFSVCFCTQIIVFNFFLIFPFSRHEFLGAGHGMTPTKNQFGSRYDRHPPLKIAAKTRCVYAPTPKNMNLPAPKNIFCSRGLVLQSETNRGPSLVPVGVTIWD